MSTIVIFGAGGHAKVVIDIVRSSTNHHIIGVVDNIMPKGTLFYGCKVIGNDSEVINLLKFNQTIKGVVAIGDNNYRQNIVNRIIFNNPKFEFVSAAHNSALISASAKIGVGSVVMPGVIINSDVKIGKHCIINTNVSVDHDCIIEDFASLSPRVTLAGGVKVCAGAFLGTSATVIPEKIIGANAIIGAGAVVVNDIASNVKALGVPAKTQQLIC